MADDSIAELTAQIQAFCGARDWRQFHAPKELAVAIAAEAGELLQHFVWQTPAQSEQRAPAEFAQIEATRFDAISAEAVGRFGA